MPKYRLLTTEELKALEQDFIKYLIVNGIDADEWSKIQAKDLAKAQQITELFSDVVFEKILRNVTFLRHQTEDSLHCFHYQESQAAMIGIKSHTGSLVLDDNIPSKLTQGSYELITGKKSYQVERSVEIFQMTMKGAEISDGNWYRELAKMF